ncbi:response regulator transcription factor [Noviherbaspirillum sp.]|uniref:response regulator transcription factor n=1 Tax=Noviherbaspirillum sp. TaxID=1926288 RepID=UPI002FE0BA0E
MKILIVDDHVLFREGLKLLLLKLNPDMTAIEASNLDDALHLTTRHDDIDLVLFDLGLPGRHGVDALSEFRQENDHLPTVVLSAQEDPRTVLDALVQGAMGFIPKTTSFDALQAALQTVLNHGIYVPPVTFGNQAAAPSLRKSTRPAMQLSELGLTDRQMQVFRLIVQGKSNKAIAKQLCIAESTIKQHVKPILKALNVTSRVGAIVEVARLGIVLDQ